MTLDSNECQKLWGDSLLSDPKGVMEGSSPLPPALKNYFFIVYLLYNVVLVLMYSKVDQIYIYISLLFWISFPFSHCRALRRGPCAAEQVLIRYLF